MTPRWMLYSYDALGLGHVRRMLAIARALSGTRPDASGLLVTCSPLVDALPVPPGLDYIKLPSARKVSNGHYVARSLGLDPARLRTIRANLLTHTARSFDPDLLLVDKMPLGLMGELGGAIEALHAGGSTQLVLGWRDILDAPDAIAREWRDTPMFEWVRENYDELWVFGDPDLFDVRREYRMPDDLANRVRFTGYLSPACDETEAVSLRRGLGFDGDRLAVITVGGGEDGERVLATYLEAARRGLLPRDMRSLVVTGPCMARRAQERLVREASNGVTVRSFIPDLAPLLRAADVVVGMAGYNTVSEWLAGDRPAVFIPRTSPRREQWIRASRLAERGLCSCLDPEGLTPQVLAASVARALATPPRSDGTPRRDGLAEVARMLAVRLPGPGMSEPASEPARSAAP